MYLWYNVSMNEEERNRIKNQITKSFRIAEESLAPYATREKDCIRRNQSVYNFFRRGFVRDCETVINLAQYNRYGGKTQVFSLHANNDISTRASHVGLVSRIARTLGRALNLNCDLIEAIASAHDLGHAPFGHKGEKWLDNAAQKYGLRFFHHVQGARYLDCITRSNMALQVIDGVLCHNGEQVLNCYRPNKYATTSFDILNDKLERAYKGKLPGEELMPATLEGCLVRLCDTVAYLGKDRQDADRLGIRGIRAYKYPEDKVLNHEIIRLVSEDVIYNSAGKAAICLSPSVHSSLINAMKENYEYIYTTEHTGISSQQYRIMQQAFYDVFDFLYEDMKKGAPVTEKLYFPYIYANPDSVIAYREDNRETPERVVTDFIASMCDDYFISFHNKFIGTLDIARTDYFD